jgi:nicotinamide-nucleotide amidase
METDDQHPQDVQTDETTAPRVLPDRSGPVRIEIISIGRELVRGRVADANARKIAAHFNASGGRIGRITVVDDDLEMITRVFRETLERNPHLVVSSGGLGPAPDDLTLAAISATLKLPLSINPVAKTMVEEAYQHLARTKVIASGGMNLAREKMCRLPVGSTPVTNRFGLSPGVLCRLAAGAAVLCLPGKPNEMKAVLEEAVPLLKEIAPREHIAHHEIESPTPDESSLKPLLEKLHDEFPAVWITSHPSRSRKKGARVMISFESTAASQKEAETAANLAIRKLLALASGSS